jgi:putative FmdB family regulatory protein
MPIYEYRCTTCGEEFEILQRISDRPLRRCRRCKGKLEKLISRSSFMLKGGGWYKHGYTKSAPKSGGGDKSASKGGSSNSASKGGSSSSGSKGGSSSADSKP